VDARVMKRDWIILGGGNRTSKIKASPEVLRHAPDMTVVADLAK
jgi:prolyl-tRNA editing enzyme YbaK/EbsC (Cys-tRNA(Pro) deacylase)